MSLTVYGIPTCGTVKKVRAWLDSHQLVHEWVDLRATPPAPDRVARWVAAFGAAPLRNTSGGAYRALGAEKDAWSTAEWTEAFARDPMLIKRPVLERDGVPYSVGGNEAALARLVG